MGGVLRSLAGTVVSGALMFSAAIAPAIAAPSASAAGDSRQAGEFRVGEIWSGRAQFNDKGAFVHCVLEADFPQGWGLLFDLGTKGELSAAVTGTFEDGSKDAELTVLKLDGATLGRFEEDDIGYLFVDLHPAARYLPALKGGENITVVLQDKTHTWSPTAALPDAPDAFSRLEACVSTYAGSTVPAAAKAATASRPGAP